MMEIDLGLHGDKYDMKDIRLNVDRNTMNDTDEGHDEDEGDVTFSTIEPYLEMEFNSKEEAYSFYREYAKSIGFGTSKLNSRRSRVSGEFIDAKFVCCKYGSKQRSNVEVANPRPDHKTDCKASMYVKKVQDRNWFVYGFVKEHNHELFPSQSHFFRSHRRIDPTSTININILQSVGIQTSKIYAAMSKQYNGYQKVGCLEKDVRNQIDRERRLGIEAGDAQAMLEHFIHMQKENLNFFYSIELNDDQSVRNVFWVDAKGRDDYIYFGDVVSFDSTYFTNKYKMPFAPFIGVNHHFQSILLGCAIIADETTSTYVWLMRTWLKAMGGKAPKAIVTDQDKAMKATIAEVFSNSRHRFCLWHIMRKIPEKLGHVTRKYENFMAQLNKCIYKSWTEEQFENRWWKMVETFELRKNGWIKSLYEDRKQWVPTYMRDTFFAGMSTTQRSESINSFFDKYVQRKTTLKEFIEQYKVVLQDRHERESKANFDTWNRTPILKSHSPYEKQCQQSTHEIFKKFQREVLEIVACHPKKEEEDETVTMFMVHDFEANEDFIVEWEEAESKVSCLCRLFEYKGFLCRHAMTILQFSAVSKILSHYILNRWSNNAKSHNIEAPALEEVKSVMPTLKVLDPQVTKTKGAPKRIKSGIEKKKKKNNTSKKDKENSNSIVSWPSIDGYCTTQQSIQGQSSSMSLNFDGYVLQQSMQGLLQSMHG
ncbi:hypothetical protein HHK36_010093 [Tetracentron sinense]|uniref:Protein FAR1-RELATED SEQUENCE n=1 Tax=Tetracentron sinense TaxID=13715 RepID=A0A835DIU2_TETSI|nr:hypothetical protein HHK36_010093 [Tetracentron sinense]